MNCPVCKYDNKPGATHCGMCYEVFNRSAAQSYQQAVKRERIREQGLPNEPEVTIRSQKVVNNASGGMEKIDWTGITQEAASLIKRFRKELMIGAGIVGLWLLVSFLFSASLWYHVFGDKFGYVMPNRGPATYLVGLNQNIRIWSERGGRLDTPMEEFKSEEIGNVRLEQQNNSPKNRKIVQVTPLEWIQMLNDSSGSTSHAIPKTHPSLTAGRLVFDVRGVLLERAASPSPRLGKSLPFLAPRFPKGRLRQGLKWNESVVWTDVYNDWKMDWVATFHWTLGDLSPCREGTCAKMTYTASLRPQLVASPAWARGAVHAMNATADTEGEALFDVTNHRMISNTFSYEGLLRMPITNLGNIPWGLRIGRQVKDVAGEIVIRFTNKINIRKN